MEIKDYLKRDLEKIIEPYLFIGKVIIIYGARRVGKTTLCEQLLLKYSEKDEAFKKGAYSFEDRDSPYRYINCDYIVNRQALEVQDKTLLKAFIGNAKFIVIDEAQRVENIGLTLKIIVDAFPEIQIIATGSSSFDLSNKINEPLTGRAFQFMLYPLSLQEIYSKKTLQQIDIELETYLRYGLYPYIYNKGEGLVRKELLNIVNNYLYKDILEFDQIKNSKMLLNLLKLLALQVGNQVSYNELATSLGINVLTVRKYIDLLEKCFVIFTLHSYSKNPRKEISKSVKIYFYDTGIRNALIESFNPMDIRTDIGALWENFCIAERLKYNSSNERYVNSYFWRTYTQKEIDYIEEHSGTLEGYEFKWRNMDKEYKPPKTFLESYPEASVKKIDKNNYQNFLINI
ncbi:MAG: hypothetical protein A2Y25_10435 [Candidatus Melainabacteria bacterium GWF2_37_15]|nr:MAG: hypothetical protein A2Y25_10435 [Candidatus Melainabacteria bacterium GWF2_37_15]